MNDQARMCSFCSKLTTLFISSKKSKTTQRICFSCIENCHKLMKKAILIENQLSMAYFEKPKGV